MQILMKIIIIYIDYLKITPLALVVKPSTEEINH